MHDLESLKPYATERQREIIDAVIKHGSNRKAAAAIGMHARSVEKLLKRARKQAAIRGHAPEHDYTRAQPEGFELRGVSTLYDGSGNVAAQWVKSKRSPEDPEQIIEALENWSERVRGRLDPLPAPTEHADEDLLCVYPMGDPHLGLLAWHAETGNDFDLEIAERNLVAAVDQLVSRAPSSKQALIVNLGDFFHTDNQSNVTNRGGHQLDVDTRWGKLLDVGVSVMCRCIDSALKKHAEVHVENLIGNHDTHSSLALSHCLSAMYSREPRVNVSKSPAIHRFYRFGANLLGMTHGDRGNPARLQGVMSVDRAGDWGETKYRHYYVGHYHSENVRELAGVTYETFRTLAGKDAWHTAEGYRSGRDMRMDVWHRERGRIERRFIPIEAVEEMANAQRKETHAR